jgi:lipoprotein-releasing system ATP-binding protein
MNNSIILHAKNISKSYLRTGHAGQTNEKLKLEVLKSISIEIEKSKISVVVGASGAGKSTLLHILSGLDRPDNGEVIFDEENIFSLSNERLAKFRNNNIGFVFQFHHLLPEFTSLENIAIPLMINGTTLGRASKRSEELLEIVGLKDRKDHKPAELSGGEQQRVAVARALANDPQIIFADEPTGNLDSENSNSLHKIFVELKENMNKTFIIVTHNSDLVKLADKVYEIKDGKIN